MGYKRKVLVDPAQVAEVVGGSEEGSMRKHGKRKDKEGRGRGNLGPEKSYGHSQSQSAYIIHIPGVWEFCRGIRIGLVIFWQGCLLLGRWKGGRE